MTEKVKVSGEVINDIRADLGEFGRMALFESFISEGDIYTSYTPEQFSLILCGWYEVDPEFSKDDWIVITSVHGELIGGIYQIENKEKSCAAGETYCYEFSLGKRNKVVYKNEVRHATPSEIAAEKERRFWAEHGRKVWELKQGDVLTINDELSEVEGVTESVFYFSTDFMPRKRLEDIKHNIEVICFAENRLDGDTN